jgi:hypothetical protein
MRPMVCFWSRPGELSRPLSATATSLLALAPAPWPILRCPRTRRADGLLIGYGFSNAANPASDDREAGEHHFDERKREPASQPDERRRRTSQLYLDFVR